ncbi:unnamed protein product [Amoebophrya sp. A120]|nr:unnamed protein product [Amoebophrya sp. A120]|eukprot:GSA120T00002605001.1
MSASSSNYVPCTGGLGYIGSHTVIKLLEKGYRVAVLDNCANSSPVVLDRIAKIMGKDGLVKFFKLDLLEKEKVMELFKAEKFDGVIHFAGYKAVGESVAKPLEYYHNNLTGTLYLLEAMKAVPNCRRLVFSSSATVYQPSEVPLDEGKPLGPSNPYGQTKFMIEQFLQDLCVSDATFAVDILRYFNPVGAHPSGLIGENPTGPPNNLMPFIQQVGVGRREKLTVFGDDWPTPDGTGVRDYLHVDDLADGHLAALQYIDGKTGCFVHNLGTGSGVSVLEMVAGFEKASGVKIPYVIGPRRPGDLATVVADPAKAQTELQWKATRSIEEIMNSAWKWQSGNPEGYPKA